MVAGFENKCTHNKLQTAINVTLSDVYTNIVHCDRVAHAPQTPQRNKTTKSPHTRGINTYAMRKPARKRVKTHKPPK